MPVNLLWDDHRHKCDNVNNEMGERVAVKVVAMLSPNFQLPPKNGRITDKQDVEVGSINLEN